MATRRGNGGCMGLYFLYLVVMWACALPLTMYSTSSPITAAAAAVALKEIEPHWPKDPILDNPWVKQNVALAYAAPEAQDGIGGQSLRVLGIYATARALGLGYVHKQLECIGHIGGVRNYHKGVSCTNLTAEDNRLMQRLRKLITLPTTAAADTSSWAVEAVDTQGQSQPVSWDALVRAVAAAAEKQQPTVLTLSAVIPFLIKHPDVFLAVPEMQPKVLRKGSQTSSSSVSCPAAAAAAAKPWLLSGLRIAVHLRRGDIRQQHKKHGHRYLPIEYYVNVLSALVKELDSIGRDFAVEVYTEHSNNNQEWRLLRQQIPQLTLLINTDLVWNWQMMASADIMVLSWSSYSFVAALLNPDALHIASPLSKGDVRHLHLQHWYSALDDKGTLPEEVLQEVRARFGVGPRQQQGEAQLHL